MNERAGVERPVAGSARGFAMTGDADGVVGIFARRRHHRPALFHLVIAVRLVAREAEVLFLRIVRPGL